MTYQLTLVKHPSGRYGFVGSIPMALCNDRDATKDDIMGQRWHTRADGTTGCYYCPTFENAADAVAFAISRGVTEFARV